MVALSRVKRINPDQNSLRLLNLKRLGLANSRICGFLNRIIYNTYNAYVQLLPRVNWLVLTAPRVLGQRSITIEIFGQVGILRTWDGDTLFIYPTCAKIMGINLIGSGSLCRR